MLSRVGTSVPTIFPEMAELPEISGSRSARTTRWNPRQVFVTPGKRGSLP